MGLDIYIYRHREANDPKHPGRIFVDKVAYFRKVNFLVRWATDRRYRELEDSDNCVPMHVGDKDDLQDVVNRCEKILEMHAQCPTNCKVKSPSGISIPKEDNLENALVKILQQEKNRIAHAAKKDLLTAVKEYTEASPDVTLAAELLPTMDGFFFGSTDYDEWYFRDVQNVKETFSAIIAEAESSDRFFLEANY